MQPYLGKCQRVGVTPDEVTRVPEVRQQVLGQAEALARERARATRARPIGGQVPLIIIPIAAPMGPAGGHVRQVELQLYG